MERITFFDFEATHLDTGKARIASIGAVTVEWPPGLSPEMLVEVPDGVFERKLRIDAALANPVALQTMNYSEQAWANATQPYLAVKAFAQYLDSMHGDGPCWMGGHYVSGYDLLIWNREWRRCVARDVMPPRVRVVEDSCEMAKRHRWDGNRPASMGLGALYRHFFDCDVPDHHEALADARASAQVAAALALGWTRKGGA